MPTPTHRYLLWLVLLIVVLALVAGFAFFITPSFLTPPESAARIPPPAPALTSDRTVEAIGAAQFSALISYTDQGFEPAALSIAKGDTIRFVNNSTHAMSLSFGGAPPPPAGGLPPGEYWEFTSTTQGDASFTEQGSGASGVIHVQ